MAQLIAQGETITDAHEKAGFKRHDGNASKLADHPDIKARLAEIIGSAANRVVISLDSLLREAAELQSKASAAEQFSAANGALKLKAELSGHYVQRKEDVTPRRNTRQVDARILELLAARAEDRTPGPLGGTGEDTQGDEAFPTVPGHGTA